MQEKYNIILDREKKQWYVQLTDKCGIWAFCIISFGIVKFKNDDKDAPPKMLFEHEFNYVPEHLRNLEELKKNQKQVEADFVNLLGNILFDILDNNQSRIVESNDTCVLDFFNDSAEMIIPEEELTNDDPIAK